jgi:hypothetical protein
MLEQVGPNIPKSENVLRFVAIFHFSLGLNNYFNKIPEIYGVTRDISTFIYISELTLK